MTKAFLGLLLLSAALTAACGSSDASVSCAKTDRSGTYVAHFTERSGGTCGAITDTVLRFDGNGMAMPSGCSSDAPDKWSADECKLDRSATCLIAGTDQTLTIVGSSNETESGGAKLSGIETVTAYDSSGSFLCTSTYDIAYARQ